MPLPFPNAKTKQEIDENIRFLIEVEKKPAKQAIAMAHAMAKKAKDGQKNTDKAKKERKKHKK